MSEKSVHLPQELIVKILLRVPVKTVLRCKCVSKSWLSLISNHDFATSHFQLGATPTQKLVCLRSYSRETISIDFNASLNDDSSYASRSLDFLSGGPCHKIRGSCRGFLLFHGDTNFCAWNPSTGVHKQIPESPIAIPSTADCYSRILCGFGYESLANDYLVVLLSRDSYDSYDSLIYLQIFSLRANKWKLMEFGSHFPYCISITQLGLPLNDAIHWLVYSFETHRYVIVAFDLKEMKMSVIDLPDVLDNYTCCIVYDLLVLGGLLGVWNVELPAVDIWMIQEYPTYSSWSKTHSFSLDSYFSPICFANCGYLIGIDDEGGLIKFNDKGQLLERHSNGNSSYCNFYFGSHTMIVYRESLFSLPNGSEQT
ncbi:F-box protein CPR1-like [Vicia villosa]|uniref:F-box protein CPR1-like n=1 Tax=Vicia villosa TaxID=3911 RepID=UPI00273BD355|nr:F-box protein CPR1-like [Vicia villosa]